MRLKVVGEKVRAGEWMASWWVWILQWVRAAAYGPAVISNEKIAPHWAFVPVNLIDTIFIQFIQRIRMNGCWKCDRGGVPAVAYFIAVLLFEWIESSWGFFPFPLLLCSHRVWQLGIPVDPHPGTIHIRQLRQVSLDSNRTYCHYSRLHFIQF